MTALKEMGYFCLGLETNSDVEIEESFKSMRESSIALVVGSEALGIRELTRKNCDITAKIGTAPASESLNVSNAAALALFLANRQLKLWASNKRT